MREPRNPSPDVTPGDANVLPDNAGPTQCEDGDWHCVQHLITILPMSRHLALLALVLLPFGCGGSPDPTTAPEPLRIAAASDLQTVMPKLIARFQELHRIELSATYGASGQFAQQIKQGAPYDLFLSANRKFVADLANAKIIVPETVRDYAKGSLALVIRDEVPDTVKSLADLMDPSIKKIAVANPETAPYGAAAKQALQTVKLWDVLEPKRVQAETVRQALQFVQTGNAEAGLVGKAIANVPGVRVIPIDEALHEPLWQAVGVVADSKMFDHANAFITFIREGEGKTILRDAGFTVDFER